MGMGVRTMTRDGTVPGYNGNLETSTADDLGGERVSQVRLLRLLRARLAAEAEDTAHEEECYSDKEMHARGAGGLTSMCRPPR